MASNTGKDKCIEDLITEFSQQPGNRFCADCGADGMRMTFGTANRSSGSKCQVNVHKTHHL